MYVNCSTSGDVVTSYIHQLSGRAQCHSTNCTACGDIMDQPGHNLVMRPSIHRNAEQTVTLQLTHCPYCALFHYHQCCSPTHGKNIVTTASPITTLKQSANNLTHTEHVPWRFAQPGNTLNQMKISRKSTTYTNIYSISRYSGPVLLIFTNVKSIFLLTQNCILLDDSSYPNKDLHEVGNERAGCLG